MKSYEVKALLYKDGSIEQCVHYNHDFKLKKRNPCRTLKTVAVNVNTFARDCLNRSLDRFEVLIVVYFLDSRVWKKNLYTHLSERFMRPMVVKTRWNDVRTHSLPFHRSFCLKYRSKVLIYASLSSERGVRKELTFWLFSQKVCVSQFQKSLTTNNYKNKTIHTRK